MHHKTLAGQHNRKITQLVANNNELWSCSDDGNIIVWNVCVESLVREIHVSVPANFIKLVGDNIWSGTGKCVIRWSKSVIILFLFFFCFLLTPYLSVMYQWMRFQPLILLVQWPMLIPPFGLGRLTPKLL